MASIREQIEQAEEEIFKTQKNKSTEHHIGKLKAKVAKLREEMEKRARSQSGGGKGYAVKKSGNATVGLVGFPSVGKSTLLNKITEAKSEVGAYQFTTLTVIPGVMEYRGAKIQILDMPGIIGGAARGKGRGREVLAVARTCDLILLFLDVFETNVDVLVQELEGVGIRLNQKPPGVVFTKKERGGLVINYTAEQTHMDEDQVKDILGEMGMVNMDVVLREDITQERLIDAALGNRIYIPGALVLNKIDLVTESYLKEVKHRLKDWNPILISASGDRGLEELKAIIYDSLDLIPLYLKPQGEKADMEEPLIVRRGSTVGEVCDAIHRDFRERFRYAYVWGPSAKFPGQNVGLNHQLEPEDVITIIVKK
ncbi:MAG: GTP-binding protein [Candidatus Thermoplasmatota archaeon]|nr:GTP-binding protein [Candidatus Thermoplasmatota archaeon]